MISFEQPSLIEYPCDFPIKILGRADGFPVKAGVSDKTSSLLPEDPDAMKKADRRGSFIQAVLLIVKRHAPDFEEAGLEVRSSSKETYVGVTCTIRAISQAQVNGLYQDLCEHPMVLMVL
jgi:uncharacterized protein